MIDDSDNLDERLTGVNIHCPDFPIVDVKAFDEMVKAEAARTRALRGEGPCNHMRVMPLVDNHEFVTFKTGGIELEVAAWCPDCGAVLCDVGIGEPNLQYVLPGDLP